MQIHELNNFSGTPGASDYFATDNGTDTSKISATNLYAPLNARIDNIIAGPAPSAKEIIDARLGVGGEVYPSLGDAIRGQVTDLKSELSGYVSLGSLIANRYIKTNDGTEGAYNGWSCTDFIECGAYESLIIYSPLAVEDFNAFYDSSKTFISAFSLQSGNNPVNIPTNARYLRLSNITDAMTSTSILSNVGLIERDIKTMQFDLDLMPLAQKTGYYNIIPMMKWETGSITYPNGRNRNPDTNVIRTALPRMQFSGDINFIFMNDQYRARILGFTDDSGSGDYDSGWKYSNTKISIETNKYYRIQIATNTASVMDMEEALQSILFVYSDDTMSTIEPFWNDYIETKVQEVNSYMTNGTDKTAFLFLTDTHWNKSSEYLNHYGVNAPLMKYVADKCNVQYMIHGGDLNSEYRSNKNIAREMMTEPMAMMRNVFEHVLVTRGNHDDNNESGNDNWSYTITQADSYSYMFRNTKDVVFGETGTYFYHDIPFEKVRIISLDCADFPYTNDVDPDHLDEKLLAYGHTQLQWLCDTLKSTPSGYHIVIYTHAMLAPSIVTVEHPNDSPQTRASNYQVVARILQAYKNRDYFHLDITGWFEAVHQSYYDGILDVDFTNCSGSIVAVFSGHEHVDCIEEIEVDGAGIGIYNTCTQNSSAMFGDSVISHTYQHPMEIGTTSELVWDMVVIDRASKHVDMIRIGANGANTDIEAFDVRSFDYV